MKKILPILTLILVLLSLLILTSCGCIHHYSWIDKDPTCTEQGEHIEKCIRCGHVKNHYYTDALAHDYGYVCSVEPTCAEPSYEKYTCSMCGDIKKENLGSYTLPHTIEYTVIKEPTCQEKGIALEKCLNCDYSTGEYELDILNHRFMSNWVIEIEPTCSSEGEKRDYCIYDCGQYISNIIETAPHNLVYEERVEPTCDKTGLTEGEHCSNCDFVIAEQQTIPTIPHTFTDAYDATCNACGFEREPKCAHTSKITLEAVEPTCTKPGKTAGQQCANPKCGEIIKAQQEIPAKGHSYTETVIAATCTSQGYTVYKCSCGDEYKGNYVDQKDHVYEHWMLFTSPTCTSTGLRKSICENCTSVISETVSKLPHSYNSVVTKPTTTSQGYTTYTCTGCGHSYVDSYTDPLPKTSEGLEFQLSADGKSYMLSGIGTCTDKTIVIPQTYNDKPVTSIAIMAFANNKNITGVIIPEGIVKLGNRCFSHCESLTNVSLPNTLTTIEWNAFEDCSQLITVNIDAGGSHLATIEKEAFKYCSRLVSFVIPYSVTEIGSGVFYGCKNLSTLYCYGKDNNGYNSISSLPALENVYFYNEIEKIQGFSFCPAIKQIILPSALKTIGGFKNCTSLASVVFGDNVTTIESYAFCECDSLVSITLGKNVTNIDAYAFNECYSLYEICNNSSLTFTQGNGIAKYALRISNTTDSKTVFIGDFVFLDLGDEIYLVKYLGNDSEVITPTYRVGTKYTIYKRAFGRSNPFDAYDYPTIDSLVITSDVKKIERYAQEYVTINNITLTNTVKELSFDSIKCTNLYYQGSMSDWCKIKVPNGSDSNSVSNIYINGELFSGNLIISNNAEEISPYILDIFREKVETITIKEGVTSIKTYLLPSSATTFIIPRSVTTIEDNYSTTGSYIVNYQGTVSEWKAITILGGRNPFYKSQINCTDGVIGTDGKVTYK